MRPYGVKFIGGTSDLWVLALDEASAAIIRSRHKFWGHLTYLQPKSSPDKSGFMGCASKELLLLEKCASQMYT